MPRKIKVTIMGSAIRQLMLLLVQLIFTAADAEK
jgi:hypothetical protein